MKASQRHVVVCATAKLPGRKVTVLPIAPEQAAEIRAYKQHLSA